MPTINGSGAHTPEDDRPRISGFFMGKLGQYLILYHRMRQGYQLGCDGRSIDINLH